MQATTTKHQRSLEKFAVPQHAAACLKPQGGGGGGQPNFPKVAKVTKPRTKHKGMHVLKPCKDEHSSIAVDGPRPALNRRWLMTNRLWALRRQSTGARAHSGPASCMAH